MKIKSILTFLLFFSLSCLLIGCGSHKHHYTEQVIDPTCSEAGYTEFTCECGDTYKENYTSALGHEYSETVVKATCVEDGYIEYVCNICGNTDKVIEPATGHQYDEGIIIANPTETEKGFKKKTCLVCENELVEEIPPHVHSFVTKTIDPTCTEKGYDELTCECGYSIKQNEVEALGHTEEEIPGIEATCESPGVSNGKQCSICHEILEEQVSIPALEHLYGEWELDEEESNDNSLCFISKCQNCNHVQKKYGSNVVEIHVTYKYDVIYIDQTVNFDYTVIPLNAYDTSVNIYTDKTDVIKVENNNITGLKIGVATVTVESVFNPKIKTTFEVVVGKENINISPDNDLCKDIEVDKFSATVYYDSTLVTYTVITSLDADQIDLIHVGKDKQYNLKTFDDVKASKTRGTFECYHKLSISDENLSNELIKDVENDKLYSAKKEVKNDKIIWTIQWDLMYTAVKFVEIDVIDNDKNITHENFVKLDINFPSLDLNDYGVKQIFYKFIEENLTGSFIFHVDHNKVNDYYKQFFDGYRYRTDMFGEEIVLLRENIISREELRAQDTLNAYKLPDIDSKTLWNLMFDDSPIWLDNAIELTVYNPLVILTHQQMESGVLDHYTEGKKILIPDINDKYTFAFNVNVTDDTRALIAYQNGYEIDKDRFPYAYDIKEKASKIIDDIIKDGMTDFEKEQAIYRWMMSIHNNGYKGLQNIELPSIDDPMYNLIIKTSYGLINEIGGDCMGWSGTFYLLCNMVGIPCAVLPCESTAGGPASSFNANHRINVIRLDGEFYFVEVFWFYQKNNDTEGDYRFMNLTTEEATKYYKWCNEEFFGPPVTEATKYKVDEHTGELLNK